MLFRKGSHFPKYFHALYRVVDVSQAYHPSIYNTYTRARGQNSLCAGGVNASPWVMWRRKIRASRNFLSLKINSLQSYSRKICYNILMVRKLAISLQCKGWATTTPPIQKRSLTY
nr:MAG TPA: hypothetical protein [Caudoviricetes sp.]